MILWKDRVCLIPECCKKGDINQKKAKLQFILYKDSSSRILKTGLRSRAEDGSGFVYTLRGIEK